MENLDNFEWCERSEFWKKYAPPKSGGHPKHQYREPLILTGHGIRLRVDHNTLLIKTGLTHFPQKPKDIRIFPGDPHLPDRIVVLDGSGGVTFDALNWMAEQQIEFVRLDWTGRVSSVAGQSGYSAKSNLTQVQNSIVGSKRQIEIIRFLMVAKFKNSISTLREYVADGEFRKSAILRLNKRISEIRNPRNSYTISKILGAEGDCALHYFRAWRGIPLNWVGNRRIPIPSDWSEFSTRNMIWRKRQSLARHPLNAMLNYAYGVAVGELRSGITAAGLDPTIGVLHSRERNIIPLVYDLLEPMRPIVDGAVLKFVAENEFHRADFTIGKSGGCRLNPQLARALVANLNFLSGESHSGVTAFAKLLH